MLTLKEIRKGLPDRMSKNVSYQIRHIITDNFDFDVYLPTKGFNLQRERVWSESQNSELIWSILIGRPIPTITLFKTYNADWQVIDGKQRLNAIFDFYNDKFPIWLEGKAYTYSTIAEYNPEFRKCLQRFDISVDYVFEDLKENQYDDNFKINWFRFINFAGSPQEHEHLFKLELALQNNSDND